MSNVDPQTRSKIDDLVLLDVSEDARDAARDRADARLSEELYQGGRLQRIAKSIWKGGIAKEYYRQKYIKQAHTEIQQAQDVLIHEEDNQAARQNAMLATIERFQSEYDGMVHNDAGEQRGLLAETSEINVVIKDLISQYAGGQLNEESLHEEFTRAVSMYRKSGGTELSGAGVVQINNVLEVARQVRSAVEHGESMDAVMREFNVVAGEARTGVRSEAKYDKVEKIIDKIHSTRVGAILGPEVVTAGVSIAASVARLGSEKAVYAAAGTVSLGLGAGVLSGLRERKRVKDERTQHAREMAQGKEMSEGSKRREEMETTRYETVSATDLRQELIDLFAEDTLEGGGNDALEAALDALARAETFVQLSDQKNIDLISYSDVSAVATERFELDLARAEAKVSLRHRLDDATRLALGIAPDQDVTDIIDMRSTAFIESIDSDMSEKDQAFAKLRRRRMIGAAARGAATGIVFGVVAQEAFAAVSDTRAGAVERIWNADNQPYTDGMQHNTLINGFIEGDTSTQTVHHDPSSQYTKYELGDNGKIMLPDDYKLIDHNDGTVSIVDPEGNPDIPSMHVNEDGSLPKSSRQLLKSHGIEIDNISKTVSKTTDVDIEQYLGSKHDETTHVTRELWYDNDTPKPVFDENELGMSWGGDAGSGITQNGDYSFNVAGMQADGSYHGAESVNWSEQAQSGSLKLAVSASIDTQAHVFLLDIKPNGEVIIPKNGPAGALFANENGHAVFKGAYAETVQVTGTENGVTGIRPLATVVGENNPGKIPVTTEVQHPGYKLTPPGYETTTGTQNFTEMAPVIPVDARRGLEPVRRRTAERRPYSPGYGGMSPEVLQRAEQDRSPRLQADPTAQLELGEELAWHDSLVRRNASAEYVQDLEHTIANTPELQNIDSQTKAIITIPVGAALEADNIYRTLSLYGQQEDKGSIDSTMILLHVNWIDADLNDPKKAAAIQKTKDEIERAKRQYPDLRITVIQSEWSRAKLDSGQYGDRLIGHVSQKMYDAAMMSVKQAVDKGRMSADDDVLVIKNDADALGMDKRYLEKMIRAFEEHPENDVFTGAIRWGAHRSRDLPGFGYVTQFLELTRIAAQRSNVQGFQSTFGVNAAIRMSTFAAIGGIGHYSDQKESAPDDLAIGERVQAARTTTPKILRSSQSGNPLPSVGRSSARDAGILPTTVRSGGVGSQYGRISRRANDTYDYHRHVAGADIDTDADRMEAQYIQGKPITRTWDGVNAGGGFTGRSELLEEGEKESLVGKKSEAVVARIEENISALISDWLTDRRQVAAGLAFMTPGPQSYRITRNNGRLEFRFTDEGKEWLVNRLRRNARGQFDAYGNRKMRALYGDVAKNSSIRPNKATPRMAGGVLAFS